MKKYLRLSFLVWLSFSSFIIYAQRGKDGALTVSSVITVNEYTSLTADASTGNTSITVAASSLNAHGRFSANLSEGDLIMIIQMQGATINGVPSGNISTPNDSSWGAVLNYNNCGNNEIREVLSVPNGTTINLTCPLVNNYTAAGKVQIVRIPRYSSLTINNGGEIVPDLWDSVSGGIIAIEDLGNTVINAGGQINAYASGFRGGALQNSNAIVTGITYVASNQPNINGAYKGEGIAGNGTDYDVFGGGVCMGAPANGGGGGDSWNAGGGGGANGGNVTGWINGYGIPDISQPGYITAWNLEYTWMSSFVGAGGGRGGYTWSGSTPNPLVTPPGNASWSGDDRRSVGGRGGRPLDYSTGRLFLGGGGGAGSEDNNHAGPGGNGGGMIYLVSYGTVSGSGMISANGHNGVSDTLLAGDGPGGAGAGGTIVINSTGNISGVTMEANGAIGGNQLNTAPEGEGPGGGGGGGYIATSNIGVIQQVKGGPNGTTTTFPTFPANGSTKGGPGDTATVTNFAIIANNDTICPGNTATLTATLSGTVPGGTTIEWSDSIAGGVVLGSGSSFTTPILTVTTTFYVSTCPGDYRQAVTVVVVPNHPVVSSPNDSICKGDSALLIAHGGGTYTWSTSQTSDSIKVAPLINTTYTLTCNNGYCNKDTTFTVYLRPPVAATAHAVPDSVCPLGTSMLKVVATGEPATYKWSNGGTYDTTHVNPSVTTTYTVNVYGVCDTTQVTIKVYVIPLDKPVVRGTNSKCKGVTDTLFASGGVTYKWSSGATTTSYITGPINADSIVTLTTYNSLGCPSDTTFSITLTPLNVLTVPPVLVCKGNSVLLTPNPLTPGPGAWNYSWSPGGITGDSITVMDTSTTNYTLTISNASGCSERVITKVTPYIPILTTCCDKIILLGDDTVMTAYGNKIKTYSWSPAVTCLNPLCDSVKVNPTVTTTYTVTGKDSSGCETESIITIIVETPCANLIVPNVFTPGNAGLAGMDNIFYIKTENLSSWSIIIYDRWGKEMYSSTNPDQYWTGTAKGGGEAPAGVYYYLINATCQGASYKKDGYVQLIR